MLYTEFLKSRSVVEALKNAGVDHVPSFITEDFSYPKEIFEHASEQIIDKEILHRRAMIEHEQKVAEYKKQFAKELAIEEKAKFIRPFVEKIVRGNLSEIHQPLEDGVVNVLSEFAAKNFDYEPGESESKQEDYSGLSELQALLKQAGVTRLSYKPTLEEISLRSLHQSGLSKMLK